MEVRMCTALALALAVTPAAEAKQAPLIRCVAAGSWVCSQGAAEESICIDGPRHKGERYKIDFRKGKLRRKSNSLSFKPANSPNTGRFWELSNGGSLSLIDPSVYIHPERRNRAIYYLENLRERGRRIELWCDQ
ncbi:hypothetical protein [Sphingosinicella sp. BN140058]|uniref:hypothetical protein n=1 Tax=Sphingosinicella sp. BN140058 TaxID=1892855 RepID=UPI0010117D50|nr:hypothetical protein [Sphingosinicella sp. BN140058]QAY78911.1 hypothetical protein ETR14_22005 [Sphingosinicella sp. BN140058]